MEVETDSNLPETLIILTIALPYKRTLYDYESAAKLWRVTQLWGYFVLFISLLFIILHLRSSRSFRLTRVQYNNGQELASDRGSTNF